MPYLFQKPTFGRRHGILWINVLFTIYLKGSIQGLAPNFMMKWFFKTFMRGMFPEREKIGPSFVKTQWPDFTFWLNVGVASLIGNKSCKECHICLFVYSFFCFLKKFLIKLQCVHFIVIQVVKQAKTSKTNMNLFSIRNVTKI